MHLDLLVDSHGVKDHLNNEHSTFQQAHMEGVWEKTVEVTGTSQEMHGISPDYR